MFCRRYAHTSAALLALATCALLLMSQNLSATTITNKGGTGTLNRKQSWIGNKVPGSGDIALWNSSGAATVNLGSNLSWLGIQITTASGGDLTINSGYTLTLGSSGIDMSGAGINFNLNCAVAIAVAQTWSVNSGKTLAAAGIISGAGGITKTGAGTLTLSGANTYTGNTTISAGTLSIGSASALGSGSGALTISPTGILQATGTFSTSRAVSLGGTGGAASGGTFDVTGTNNVTRTGVISGSGSLTKTGTGILTLSGVNTYTGDTYINGGTLSIANGQSLGPQPAAGSSLYGIHMANGTTLQTTTGFSSGYRQLELVSGTATLDSTSGLSHQRNGLIYGAGGVIKTGGGTEIFTNANTYTGGTTINAGTLQINNATGSGTGSGAVAVNSGGTLSGLPTATGFATPGAISGRVTVNSGGTVLARSGGTFTFGGLTLNASAISTFQIGAPTNTAIINITGVNGLTLGGLSTVNISNAGGLAAGTYHLFDYNGSSLASIANLQLGSTPGGGFTYSLVNNQGNTSVDLLVLTSTEQWGNAAGGNWTTAANWANGVVPNAIGAQANFLGASSSPLTITLNAAETVGSITFNNANAYTIVGSSLLTLNNNGVANINVVTGSHAISAPLALANDLSINAASTTALNLAGAIGESTAGRAITVDGAGTTTFSGSAANTYTGLTTVNAGTLSLNKTAGVDAIGTGGLLVKSGAGVTLLASNQVRDTAAVQVDGSLTMGTFSETLGALTGAGTIVTGTGSVLTVGATNNLSSQFDGVISGLGTIAKAGTGTLSLTGTNTFGGAGQTVAVNAGTLQVSSDSNLGNAANSLTFNSGTLALSGAFSSSRAIALPGNGTIDTGVNADTFSGVISGAGRLTKLGTGTLTVSGPNTYSGGTTINAGTVLISSASNLGASTGSLTINDGALEVAGTFSTTRNISLGNAASTIQVDSSRTYTVAGTVSGSGTLNQTGSGSLTLTHANTFSGATNIDGTLTAAAVSGSALASTSVITVNNGGTLLLGASDQINNVATVTLDGGTFAKGNFSEGSAASGGTGTNTVGMGALTLTDAGSRIDFGTGTVGTLNFASFDPTVDLLSVTIDGWTGSVKTAGTNSTDRLIFNSDQSANLSLFNFTGYAPGAFEVSLGGGYWEITPVSAVPEPSTYAAAILTLLAVGYHQRRRLVGKLRIGYFFAPSSSSASADAS